MFYNYEMVVGLTGGIGSGKSCAGKFFQEVGIDVIDADKIAKNIINTNIEAKQMFIEKFGQEYIDSKQQIDRHLLRDEIFKDVNKKNILESIIHPFVRKEIQTFVEESDSIYKIIMVPLIYETNSMKFYEKIIVVDCDKEKQINRASKRDNQTKSNIENIIKNQASRKERLSIADEIIDNNSSLENLKNQVLRIHQKFLGINIDE